MQAVKDKLHDMSAMRKAKADAKAEEKAERELAKARAEIAHEVRMAREAEAEMDMHASKAEEKAEREIAKHETHPNYEDDDLLNAGAAAGAAAGASATNTNTDQYNPNYLTHNPTPTRYPQ